MEEMEELNKNNIALRLPLYPRKPPIASKSFTMISPLALSLPTDSHDVWKKPYSTNHGGPQSSETKPYMEPFNGESCPLLSDDKNMKTNIISPLVDKNENNGVVVASDINGGLPIKTKPPIDLDMIKWGSINPDTNQKKLKRILSNRISAQKSRMKKIRYMNDMEKKAKDLEAEIAMFCPSISYEEHQKKVLGMEKGVLQQKIDECEDRFKHSYMETVEHQTELKRLNEYYLMMRQETQKQEEAMRLVWKPAGLDQAAIPGLYQQGGPQPEVGMNPNQDGFDPFLNFNSLTIDPPKSLM